MNPTTITTAATFAAGKLGGSPINDAALQKLLLTVFGLMVIAIGIVALWLGRKGDPKKALNVALVTIIACAIVAMGVSAMFPQIGASILSTLF